jgi:hypothetical protein
VNPESEIFKSTGLAIVPVDDAADFEPDAVLAAQGALGAMDGGGDLGQIRFGGAGPKICILLRSWLAGSPGRWQSLTPYEQTRRQSAGGAGRRPNSGN